MSIRKPAWLLLICAIIACAPDLRANAVAMSNLHVFKMTFNLADTEGVSSGVPFESVNRFGKTKGGKAGTQQNWREPPNIHDRPFHPEDLLKVYLDQMLNGPGV